MTQTGIIEEIDLNGKQYSIEIEFDVVNQDNSFDHEFGTEKVIDTVIKDCQIVRVWIVCDQSLDKHETKDYNESDFEEAINSFLEKLDLNNIDIEE